ncbi:MAG: DeoR/GlpR transcriptional regulator [Victivallales bacterium]|nr:DeoR/GlpR transcriptional regulator [Victivallales bacterium]
MKRTQRAQRILELLNQRQHCTITELEAELDVSAPTLYRDVKELELRNLVVKNHGSIELPPTDLALDESVNSRYMLRLAKNRIGKDQIAQKALRLVTDDDIIFADSSTTVYYFIRKLLEHHRGFSNLTIVSNSGAIIRELTDPPPSITLISLGGVYNSKLNSFLGRIAVNAIKQLHISKAFISAAAISTSEVYTFHENHAEFLGEAVKHSDKAWLLADHLKFETRAVFPICPTTEFTGIISDLPSDSEVIPRYMAAGVNMML